MPELIPVHTQFSKWKKIKERQKENINNNNNTFTKYRNICWNHSPNTWPCNIYFIAAHFILSFWDFFPKSHKMTFTHNEEAKSVRCSCLLCGACKKIMLHRSTPFAQNQAIFDLFRHTHTKIPKFPFQVGKIAWDHI